MQYLMLRALLPALAEPQLLRLRPSLSEGSRVRRLPPLYILICTSSYEPICLSLSTKINVLFAVSKHLLSESRRFDPEQRFCLDLPPLCLFTFPALLFSRFSRLSLSLGVQGEVEEVWGACSACRRDRALVPGDVDPHGDGLGARPMAERPWCTAQALAAMEG